MKRILCAILAACMLFVLFGCGKQADVEKLPDTGKKDDPAGPTDGRTEEPDKPEEIINEGTDFSDMPKLDELSEVEFRKTVAPLAKAWYEFIYKQMWWSALKLSPSHETCKDEDGADYFMLSDIHSKTELDEYLYQFLSKDLYESLIDSYTLEKNGSLYAIAIASGWFGEPDFNSCKIVGKTNNSYQITFDELWGMSEQSLNVHVINLVYKDGAFRVDSSLNFEESAKLALDAVLSSGLTWDLMTVSEFHHFVSLLLLNESFEVANMTYDDASIVRYPSRETEEDQCVAYAIINGNACFVTIGPDEENEGKVGILSIDLM